MQASHQTIGTGETRRRRIVAATAVLVCLGTFGPLYVANHFARQRAAEAQLLRLDLVASKVAERANLALSQARGALEALDLTDDPPCSDEHTAVMRRFTLNTLSVEEVAFVEGGRVLCTTWRETPGSIPPVQFTLRDGIEASVGVRSSIAGSDPMLSLRKGSYLVLTNLQRFTDIRTPFDIQTAFMRGPSDVLATSPDVDRGLLAQALLDNGDAEDVHLRSVQVDGWTAVAMAPREPSKAVEREGWILYALGAVFSLLIVLVIAKLSRMRLSPAVELRTALRHREFYMLYQPIVDMPTGQCVGAEALIRWRRPDGEQVGPDVFIPLAESTGLIADITLEVVRMVMADLASTLRSHPDFHVSLNVSAADLATLTLLDTLELAVAGASVLHEQIWLEVTERACVEGEGPNMLSRARDMGFCIVIDDFGIGYSSLRYLQALPVNVLKIDRAFVDTVTSRSEAGLILPHIIDLGKTHRLGMVAEGVETQLQADYLMRRDVRHAQGWLYSKPLSSADLSAYITRVNGKLTGTEKLH